MKFRGLDRNNDGRITRDEWRGNARSFSVHDRNGDGALDGTEAGAALQEEGYDDFADLDRNHDSGISREEWRWDRAEFDRMDDNHNGSLSRSEYLDTRPDGPDGHFTQSSPAASSTVTSPATSLPVAPGDLFSRLDLDGNGAIPRTEWKGDKQSFARLDTNQDGKLMRKEFVRRHDELEKNFRAMDHDNNGSVSRKEWRGDSKAFERLDDNRDAQISRVEFVGVI